jgi:hypothetical protein
VVAAVIAAGSEKAAAHRLGLSHSTVKHHLANARSRVGANTTAQLVWILAPRLPGPEETRPRPTGNRPSSPLPAVAGTRDPATRAAEKTVTRPFDAEDVAYA